MPAIRNTLKRRQLLAGSLLAGTSLCSRAGIAAIVSSDSAVISVDQDDLMRVRIEIDVKGNVNLSKNAISSRETQTKLPVTSKATLDYEERYLRPRGVDRSSPTVAAERYYHSATSQSVLNKTTSDQSLRDAMRHVIVRREVLPESIYSAEGYFTHDELSLLKSPVSSVSVNEWLPAGTVIKDDRYEVDADSVSSVLNLSTVSSGKVEGKVAEVSANEVRLTFEGEVEGSVDGVDTQIRLIGKMTYSRQLKTCTWFALAIHETREIGKAEPGFDISATIRMVRKPMRTPAGLPRSPKTVDFNTEPPADRMYVELQSKNLQVGSMMDRRWRMIGDYPGSAVMRMVEHDVSVAQCNLRPLVQLPEGKQLTLEAFGSDVKRTLGDRAVRLVEGDQRVTAQGLRVLRVVVDGETQGVPIRWIMMHFSNDDGKRLQATFTMSGDQIESFAGNDVQFADSLRFLAPSDLLDRSPEGSRPLAGSEEGGKSEPVEVASRPERDDSSASDLK